MENIKVIEFLEDLEDLLAKGKRHEAYENILDLRHKLKKENELIAMKVIDLMYQDVGIKCNKCKKVKIQEVEYSIFCDEHFKKYYYGKNKK